jgi:hypothetical protein
MKIEIPKIWLPRTGQVTSYAAGDDGYAGRGDCDVRMRIQTPKIRLPRTGQTTSAAVT